MILAVDIGNTNTVLGVYIDNRIAYCWRLTTKEQGTSDEIGMFIILMLNHNKLDISKLKGVVIESVVPRAEYLFEQAVEKHLGIIPLIVNSDTKTGITTKYDDPKLLGNDRLVNAVAAYELYGGPVIVADFGTASKFDAVSEKGEHLGGVICPGINISVEALSKATAKLPLVGLKKPSGTLCTNTVSAIQGGIIYGFEGMTNYIITNMKRELGNKKARVVATGGLAEIVCSNNDMIDIINSYLTLDGLIILYEKNKCAINPGIG